MQLIDPKRLDGCKLCTTGQFPRDRRAEGWNDCIEYLQKCCTHVPVVDAEPVRHGCWIPNKVGAIETQFKCSECGRTVTIGNDYFGKATKYASHRFPYCHCGCKMDAEV